MFTKISQALYNPSFVKHNSDLQETDKIEKELSKIDLMYPTDAELKRNKVKFEGITMPVSDFVKKLTDAYDKIGDKEVRQMYDSTIFDGIDYLHADPEIAQQQLQKDLASLERQIVERENNLIDIDAYVMQLVTGKEGASLSLQHTYAKFVKTAEDELVKEADEEIENYYNELYDDSEGSPNFGTALEHPEKNRNKLTEDIQKHANSETPQQKFKKK